MLTAQGFDQDRVIRELVFSDLDEKILSLLDQLCIRQCDVSLLRYLDAHSQSLHTVEDIAFSLRENCADVQCALTALVDLGYACELNVAGTCFFGATTDQNHRARMRELCAWQDRWRARIQRIEQVLDGKHAEARTSSANLERQG
jgi:hypothetical protein